MVYLQDVKLGVLNDACNSADPTSDTERLRESLRKRLLDTMADYSVLGRTGNCSAYFERHVTAAALEEKRRQVRFLYFWFVLSIKYRLFGPGKTFDHFRISENSLSV